MYKQAPAIQPTGQPDRPTTASPNVTRERNDNVILELYRNGQASSASPCVLVSASRRGRPGETEQSKQVVKRTVLHALGSSLAVLDSRFVHSV